MAHRLREEFTDPSELNPGDTWERLDGQIITIPKRSKVVSFPQGRTVSDGEPYTRLDGRKVSSVVKYG